MTKYNHLTYEQRYQIYSLNKISYTQKHIADIIKVSQSTISRELSRNKKQGKYYYNYAQKNTILKRRQACLNKTKFTAPIKNIINKLLKKKYSPEQISGVLKRENQLNIHYKSIYNYIYRDKNNGGLLFKNLRRQGKKYKRKGCSLITRGTIKNKVNIKYRPSIVEDRSRIGDWEIDLVIGKNHSGALVTIVERKTLYLVSKRINNKSAKSVTKAAIQLLKPLKDIVFTITADNGKEFSYHEKIAKALDAHFYFADPYSSWQRGLNENTNGLLRQYFPKTTDFKKVSQKKVSIAVKQLNGRPRKKLEFQKPCDIMPMKTVKLVA